jgi:hypothetical protein
MGILPAGYVLCLGAYAFFQIRKLWRNNEKREAWLHAVLLTASAAVGALLLAGVQVPSLVVPYKLVFESIGKRILSP